MAGWTGLKPAASGVTGRHSNQLNYHPENWEPLDRAIAIDSFAIRVLPVTSKITNRSLQFTAGWWAVRIRTCDTRCNTGALPTQLTAPTAANAYRIE